MKQFLFSLIFISIALNAHAQTHPGVPHNIPNFCETNCITIPANTTVSLSDIPSGYNIHAYGTLSVPSNLGIKNIGTAVFEAGSTFSAGSSTNPVINTTIQIKDIPLNLIKDPEQFGTGILCFDCIWRAYGEPLDTFVRLSQDAHAGDVTLTLEKSLNNVRAGYRIVVADSRFVYGDLLINGGQPPNWAARATNQNERVQIKSISNNVITLTASLQYDHLGVTSKEGRKLYPHVGVLSRSFTIQSENPSGTRGHIFINGRADLDMAYVAIANMGRTRAFDPINDTTFNADGTVAHVGTNQRGRYSLHMHHVFGPYPARPNYQHTIVGVSIENDPKWGIAEHNSHYWLIKDSVIVGSRGAGIATEMGNEFGGVIDHNFILDSENPNTVKQESENTYDHEGRGGNGIWQRGRGTKIINNVIASAQEGIDDQSAGAEEGPDSPLVQVYLPKFPGADMNDPNQTTPFCNIDGNRCFILDRKPEVIDNNEIYSCSMNCMGFWDAPYPGLGGLPLTGNIVWNFVIGFRGQYQETQFNSTLAINGYLLVAQFNDASPTGYGYKCSSFDGLQTTSVTRLYEFIGQIRSAFCWSWNNVDAQTQDGILVHNYGQAHGYPEMFYYLNNVTFRPILANSKWIQFEYRYDSSFANEEGFRKLSIFVNGLNGHPEWKFQVYANAQAPFAPAPPPEISLVDGVTRYGCPEAGLTNQQSWTKYQCATLMEVARDTATVPQITGILAASANGTLPDGSTTPPLPPTEICGDGIDNDNDGLIDEGCAPPPIPISTSWICSIPAVIGNYPDGSKKVTFKCPSDFTLKKLDSATITKANVSGN